MARPTFTTPAGVSRHNHLEKPDDYMGKKRYKTTLILSDDDSEELRKQIIDHVDAAFLAWVDSQVAAAKDDAAKKRAEKKAKGYTKKYPFAIDTDREGNEIDGQYAFRFSQNAVITLKDGTEKNVKPLIVDAYNNPISGAEVWGGSTIRVLFTMRTYAKADSEVFSATLDLAQVQLIKSSKQSGGGGGGQSSGFDVVEGGYRGIDDADDHDAPDPSDEDIPF